MDSVTSGGSLQSSSGEADDFATTAATADSLSAIFHHSFGAPAAAVVSLPPSGLDHHHSRHFFDPISYLDSISSVSPPSWPPPPPPPSQPPLGVALSSPPAAASLSVSQPPVQPPASAGCGDAPRSSKKRSRASRRAQTTVLTTDTSNFRAMVQQFTGIPSLPFDIPAAPSSSPFARSRFGLFRSSSSSFSPLSSQPPPPPLLLQPFPLKTSAGVAAAAFSSSSSPTPTACIAASSSASHGGRNAPTTQSPMLTLQSLLQDMPAFFSTAKSTTGTPTQLVSSELWSPAPPAEICGGSQQGAISCKMNYLAPAASSASTSPELNAEKELAAPPPASKAVRSVSAQLSISPSGSSNGSIIRFLLSSSLSVSGLPRDWVYARTDWECLRS